MSTMDELDKLIAEMRADKMAQLDEWADRLAAYRDAAGEPVAWQHKEFTDEFYNLLDWDEALIESHRPFYADPTEN